MTNANDSAFGYAGTNVGADGLTKLEYFAGLAMQGIVSDPNWLMAHDIGDEEVARYSIQYAKALIEELNTAI